MKRALAVLLCAPVITGVAAMLTTGGAATGAPSSPIAPQLQTPSSVIAGAVPQQQPQQPSTTLHLGSKLHFLEVRAATAKLNSTHEVLNATLTKRKSGHTAGLAAYTCTFASGRYDCQSAFVLAGGVILGHVTAASGSVSGTVTGGSGDYQGAKGTIDGSRRSNGSVALTVTLNAG